MKGPLFSSPQAGSPVAPRDILFYNHRFLLGIALCLFFLSQTVQGIAAPPQKTGPNTAQPALGVFLPQTFLHEGGATQPPPVAILVSHIEEIQQSYLDTLSEESPFYGLYLKAEYDRFPDNNEDSNRLGIEWQLFDLGWRESLQQLNKKKVETKLQFLQMVANMQQKRFMEKLYLKNQIRIRIKGFINKKKTSVLQGLQETRKKQFQNGYATRDDYLTIHYKYQNSALLAAHYDKQEAALLDGMTYELINSGERLVLLSTATLLQMAIGQSIQIHIQNLFIQRSDFFPRWSDDLRLKLYAENVQRRDGDLEKIMGVALRLPLQGSGSREKLITIEQDVYLKQKEAIRKRLAQRIPGIIERIRFHQQRIIIGTNEYTLMEQRLLGLTSAEKSSLPMLDNTPKRTLELLEIQRLDKEMEILLARVKVYEELLELEFLVQPPTMAALFISPVVEGHISWQRPPGSGPSVKANFALWLSNALP